MPHLQSLVIVLLRPILVNVTAIVSQQPPPGPQVMGRGNGPGMNGGPQGPKPPMQEMSGQSPLADAPELSPEEMDAARTREITSKAMTGILLLLLKWLRLSRKFSPSQSQAGSLWKQWILTVISQMYSRRSI